MRKSHPDRRRPTRSPIVASLERTQSPPTVMLSLFLLASSGFNAPMRPAVVVRKLSASYPA
eukprot:scaffold81262_cov31-Tisochrysis_lutea.AAC.2